MSLFDLALVSQIVKEISYTEDDMSIFAVEHGLAEKTQAKYTLSIYFISSIFTTVGFGDIAVRPVCCTRVLLLGLRRLHVHRISEYFIGAGHE